MALSPEVQAKIQVFRDKARAGTITQEELREAVALMREDRVAAAKTSAKSKASKAPIDADALLSELDGL